MIYTCTLNPSIDYVAKVKDFKEGELNRTESAEMYPGGKGINVSRVLKHLGIESTALGYTGGFTGEFIKEFLTNETISHDFITVSDLTRINVKLKSEAETEINGLGPNISASDQEELLEKINRMNEGDFLVLAGSIPPSISEDFYGEIAKECLKKGVKNVIDTAGTSLIKTFEHKPFLIKPNHHELGDLFQTKIESVEDAVFYGKKLLNEGVENVIVSMAGEGAIFLNKQHTLLANVPAGTVKNSVGAGDSVVAGFLSQITQNSDIQTAFKYGVAAGSATAFSEDLCTKDFVEKLVKEISIQEM
ncbi:1-phosphofructokinase [Fictibacillus phosphorivorans]|uniref:1-phosphofructokinase n=1 Tax=Fictibacillus phosphorivorans TaxID=1221500 RepID=UPI00203DB6A8|nr:1-phosphofructokinase [Fictibacillus phosphorivorans]MCM3720176.1 1-phosphofructokinase [Fictibacillus phosphorivorans]MCM3777866.1 1-phosphofructokinase [Fictibacillus phosphorivorans]